MTRPARSGAPIRQALKAASLLQRIGAARGNHALLIDADAGNTRRATTTSATTLSNCNATHPTP